MSFIFLAPHKYEIELTRYGKENVKIGNTLVEQLITQFPEVVMKPRCTPRTGGWAVVSFTAKFMPLVLAQAFAGMGVAIQNAVRDLD